MCASFQNGGALGLATTPGTQQQHPTPSRLYLPLLCGLPLLCDLQQVLGKWHPGLADAPQGLLAVTWPALKRVSFGSRSPGCRCQSPSCRQRGTQPPEPLVQTVRDAAALPEPPVQTTRDAASRAPPADHPGCSRPARAPRADNPGCSRLARAPREDNPDRTALPPSQSVRLFTVPVSPKLQESGSWHTAGAQAVLTGALKDFSARSLRSTRDMTTAGSSHWVTARRDTQATARSRREGRFPPASCTKRGAETAGATL
ncbi:PREDICTED: uncharacterized protein LOC108531779 [Rhinopithecus bieti]|uniref:uncharacterized protein LOC108531779 n=1 Tax=Rhinopithecus bieti TaxID=61621 RepID=UPI00083C56A0|nr:PREDICTED: uncharacterized protein LOC108531779 [Rhinopithecus bieti]